MEGVGMMDLSFYKSKRVLITGHTGFKGSWLCSVLLELGAEVFGYSLSPTTKPNLFELLNLEHEMTSEIGDIRDLDHLVEFFQKTKPEVVLHLAAQPLVIDSYNDPVYTYQTNVLGTVNVLEAVRKTASVKSFLNVTTDKVYQNNEWEWGYRETDSLNGFDPYSNSKSCSELVTSSYKNSFFNTIDCAISTARAGNVIGGGDFSNNRIIPDCVKAATEQKPIVLRNPNSIRPYQHVLEPIVAYLMIAKNQHFDKSVSGSYNIGPNDDDCVTTERLVGVFCERWSGATYEISQNKNAPHEANFLKLDCSKIKSRFNWSPKFDIEQAVEKTVEWSKLFANGCDVKEITKKQIAEYLED